MRVEGEGQAIVRIMLTFNRNEIRVGEKYRFSIQAHSTGDHFGNDLICAETADDRMW